MIDYIDMISRRDGREKVRINLQRQKMHGPLAFFFNFN